MRLCIGHVTLCSLLVLTAACSAPVASPSDSAAIKDQRDKTGQVSSALYDTSSNPVAFESPGAWAWHTSVSVNTFVPGQGTIVCTGTIISPRHVLTAASCFPSTSTNIGFFWAGQPDDAFTPRAGVVRVYERAGVGPTNNWQDGTGHVFNLAVLELNEDVPWQVPAWLAMADPQQGTWAYQVGLGSHNSNAAEFGILAEHQTTVRGSGSNFANNWMLTDDSAAPDIDNTTHTRGGDMGGPLLTWGPAWAAHDEGSLFNNTGLPSGQAMTVMGVYTGQDPWDVFGNRAGYTVISARDTDFVLAAMGMKLHIWQQTWSGTPIDTIDVTGAIGQNACADLCVKHHTCVADHVAFDESNGRMMCTLFSQVTGSAHNVTATADKKDGDGGSIDATGIWRL